MKTGELSPAATELVLPSTYSTVSSEPVLITTTKANIKPIPIPVSSLAVAAATAAAAAATDCSPRPRTAARRAAVAAAAAAVHASTANSNVVIANIQPAPAITTASRQRQTRQPRQGRRTKKLSSEEKAKVLEVRRQRACLRCKMLKIQCSKENPCKPCLSSAVRGYERKVLSFCYCVRTRFVDVDIFQSSGPGPAPEIPPSVRALVDQIQPHHAPTLADDVFEDTLIRWLTNPDGSPPDGSIVSLLCAKVGNSESLRRAVDADLTSDFRIFLFTTSLAHTGWDGHVAHRDLCVAGHLCGSRIVRRLDRILTPQFLSKCDRETHRALLLLVFGLILGVGYSTRVTTSPSFPHALLGPEIRHSPTLWLAMKEHLAQMLAHHLIFLGSILGIKLDTAAEKMIIDTAVNRWNKTECNMWAGFAHDVLPTKIRPAMRVAALDDFNTAEPDQLQLPPPSLATPIVALSCPDVINLQTMPHLSENPASYLSMTSEDYGLPTPAVDLADQQPPELGNMDGGDRPRITRTRSVWIVQPYDDNGTREPVSVFARFHLQQGQNIGLFV